MSNPTRVFSSLGSLMSTATTSACETRSTLTEPRSLPFRTGSSGSILSGSIIRFSASRTKIGSLYPGMKSRTPQRRDVGRSRTSCAMRYVFIYCEERGKRKEQRMKGFSQFAGSTDVAMALLVQKCALAQFEWSCAWSRRLFARADALEKA